MPMVKSKVSFRKELTPEAQSHNREIHARLIEKSTFVCSVRVFSTTWTHTMISTHCPLQKINILKNPEEETTRDGWYESMLIQDVLEASFFRHKRDLGVQYTEWFNPTPLPLIAFIVTIVSRSF